jgi:hypothetical protein
MSFQSAFTQAVFKAEAENGVMESWLSKPSDINKSTKEISEKIVPYLALLENCGMSDPNGKCVYKGQYKKKNNANGHTYSTETRFYKIRLQNGSSVWWTYTSNKEVQVYIDINGPKPPNKHANDLFLFYLKDRIFAPMGSTTSSYPYKTHCVQKNSDGWGCTWYVMTYRKMDYPR